MAPKQKFQVRLTKSELRFGTLVVPSEFATLFPSGKGTVEIRVDLGDSRDLIKLKYQPQFRTLSGLKKWYLISRAEVNDVVSFEKKHTREYAIRFLRQE